MSLVRMRVIIVGLLALGLLLFYLLRERGTVGEFPIGDFIEGEVGRGIQSVVVVFADGGASRLIEERREIVVPEDQPGRAKRILEELAAGPEGSTAVRTLPPGTRIISVFFDDTGGAYVDFSQELVTNHPGGSTGEIFTIHSVVATLARNFPDVECVRFLVEGEEIETIAGHLDATVPFRVDQYR